MNAYINTGLTHQELSELSRRFGDAYYLLDVARFQSNLEEFRAAIRGYHADTEFGYSFKTNYIPVLCETACAAGMYGEVVSPLEYDMAKLTGFPPGRIIYNGPVKPFESISRALREGAIVNLDSMEEYDFVERLARETPSNRLAIGVRCNIGVEPADGSRFGIQEDNGDLESVFRRIGACGNIDVVSLHTHFSHKRDAESYATRASRLGEIYMRYCSDHPVRLFDIGGGFFGPLPGELVSQFSSPPPTYLDYADAIGPVIQQIFSEIDQPPRLVLEPGVGLVANALSFVCRVESLKTTGSRIIANTTGSVQNIKPSKSRFNLPVRKVTSHGAEAEQRSDLPVDICGYTCMEDDVMYHGFENRIDRGDYLIFQNVGAYSITFKPQFIRSSPSIVYLKDNEWVEARRQETVQDIFLTYLTGS